MEKKYSDFIASCKEAIVASVDDEGYPFAKAMLMPRKIDGNKFYFTTNLSALRTKQYQANPKASVYFFKKGLFVYTGLMLKGAMSVLTDNVSKEMIWRKGDTMYYPLGVTDPDYCVLCFKADEGRYYSNLTKQNFKIED